jgi:hypothetical protein
VVLKLQYHQAMTLTFIDSERTVIPDAPLASARKSLQGWVSAGVGIFCSAVEVAAVLLVFLGV